MRKFSRAQRAVMLHFTRHPEDLIIRVALANRRAHDLIVVPPGASDEQMYRLVRDYTSALTRQDITTLNEGVGTPTPSC